MLTPQFIQVDGTSSIALEDLKPTGSEIATDGEINIQLLDAYGRTTAMYSWIDWDGEPTGWCNGDFEVVEGVTFDAGQGLWVGGTSANAAIQSAGKVPTSDAVVQLRNGSTATGNPFPTTVDLQDIVVEGKDIATDGEINIQLLDAYGRTTAMYSWIDWDGEPTGWCNGDFEVVEGVTFNAGQGLWVGGTTTTQYLRFPAPEL